ncbi:response regulator transcription factor [Sulfoacidibacillus ferrooxidans]|uniref:Alkaline phosphatase synthesis transcriptional regulatory protein PhoP n=1 Tax=Sulfoacidibacillus ferrooxidans TaxID=2005001 RepID=A0A9X1VAR7_9BACL|nr:response regulator transcription factor [Sulfoacidibacillus ferrooxidans]MCI0182512.1 Alkaline phosphatase synthesis transcriptional regulatory protein PhoP [Sulfoacidibacillus ferrooxidans]
MEPRKLIYVVDDDENVRMVVDRYLIREGFIVRVFPAAEEALKTMENELPDMIILDVMLPDMNGYEFCKWIRARSDLPIIMVSARDEEVDRILGLELGSDDYLAKPFSPRELVARVRTVFRRMRPAVTPANDVKEVPSLPTCGGLVLRNSEHRIVSDQHDLTLTAKEYELLSHLILHKHQAFTREQLLTQVWGYEFISDERAIDDLVKRLRKKLAMANSRAEIVTVWGFGYKLEGEE